MMNTASAEIATYRRLFDEKYRELDDLLADLPAAALVWKPFDQSPWQGPSNSLGQIVAHAVSSTIYLVRRAEYVIGTRAWEEVDGDEGSNEFGPANQDPAYLLARVRRTHDSVNEFLAGLSQVALEQSRPHPRRADRVFTARYDILHAIDHLSQHIGHGQLTRQLWALTEGSQREAVSAPSA